MFLPRVLTLQLALGETNFPGGELVGRLKKKKPQDFPGGPMAETLCSQCRGHGFDP